MNILEINVNDYLTKSNLPASDYVITPLYWMLSVKKMG